MTSLLLVNRLRRAYWPTWCSRIRFRDVLRAEPVTRYIDERRRWPL